MKTVSKIKYTTIPFFQDNSSTIFKIILLCFSTLKCLKSKVLTQKTQQKKYVKKKSNFLKQNNSFLKSFKSKQTFIILHNYEHIFLMQFQNTDFFFSDLKDSI